MGKRNPLLPLVHIRESIEKINAYVSEGGLDQLEAGGQLLDAVERNIERISEANRRIPDDLKAGYPYIDWRGISTIGNVLRHMYESIDTRTVREVVEFDLPALRVVIDEMIAQVEKDLKNG